MFTDLKDEEPQHNIHITLFFPFAEQTKKKKKKRKVRLLIVLFFFREIDNSNHSHNHSIPLIIIYIPSVLIIPTYYTFYNHKGKTNFLSLSL